MKRILLIIFLAAVTAAACSKDAVPGGSAGEENVEMTFFTPGDTYSAARDADSESAIGELDLLVFRNDQFQYRRPGYRNGTRFRSTLKVQAGITIYFVVNAREILENFASAFIEGASWNNDIQPALVDASPERLMSDNPMLPMWGRLDDVDITPGKVQNLGQVTLLRSVASIDLYLLEDPAVFELAEAYVYFTPDRGFIAPTAANFNHGSSTVSRAESPLTMVTSLRLGYQSPAYNSVAGRFYLYDNDSSYPESATRRHTKLVVGGYYDGSQYMTYYPLIFHDGTDVYRITRNHKYIIQVISVNAEGWPDPDQAADAEPVNVDYNIIDWDISDQEVIIDGPDALSVGRKTSTLTREAFSTDLIPVTGNIRTERFSFSFIDGYTVPITNGGENDRFRVELIGQNGYPVQLRVTALQPYNESDPASNRQSMSITAGRIRFTLHIEQLNKNITDWNNGGDQGVDLE